jgi:hypothetical protein
MPVLEHAPAGPEQLVLAPLLLTNPFKAVRAGRPHNAPINPCAAPSMIKTCGVSGTHKQLASMSWAAQQSSCAAGGEGDRVQT